MDKRPYNRAVTAQRCVRAGGKHNDLENVGYTGAPPYVFEMLGNFSFGDYFKRDAIRYAWELLTVHYGLPKRSSGPRSTRPTTRPSSCGRRTSACRPTAASASATSRAGASTRATTSGQMGDTGPCGPCSEIFYDHGPAVAGGPPGSPDADGDRYIEIWNLVFMQFNRDEAGKHAIRSRSPSVDTGMGLERLTAVLQHVHFQLRDRPLRRAGQGRPRARPVQRT
jgi:alanyl-tRNA synthetase